MRNELIEIHGNKCSICEKPRSAFKKNLAVDHNGRTDKIRGLLCMYCNKYRVGRHSLESAHAVWQYLKKFDPEGG